MFYDPLGLVSTIVLQSKLIHQLLCNEKINCDTLVPESTRNVWDMLVETHVIQKKIIILKPWFNVYDENCFYEVRRFADAHLKPTVLLFTCDVLWVTPIQRHYCAPKVV